VSTAELQLFSSSPLFADGIARQRGPIGIVRDMIPPNSFLHECVVIAS